MHLLVLILRDARTRVRSLPNVFDARAPQDEAFETRARAFEVCRTPSACALLRMRTSIASFTAHDVKQPISFSRRVGVRGLRLLLRSPRMRVGGAPRNVRVLGGTPVGRAHNAARQAPSEAPCVP